jgi:cell division control protein 6
MMFIGSPGTGKTATLLVALESLRQSSRVGEEIVMGYTVAGSTAYQTLTMIARNSGMFLPFRGLGFSEAWSKYEGYVGKRMWVIAIDEMDKMMRKDGVDLLYYLSRKERGCIIGVSNKLTFMDMVSDPRVASSFRPKKIIFPPYNARELRDIIEDRSVIAFLPGVVKRGVIEYVSAIAARNGDARYGLDLILFAGDIARRERLSHIDEDVIDRARGEVETAFIEESLAQLAPDQKLMLWCILHLGNGKPCDIYRLFNNYSLNQLSERRLSSHLHDLEALGFVDVGRKGKGRGKGFEWRVSLTSLLSKDIIGRILLSDEYIGEVVGRAQ